MSAGWLASDFSTQNELPGGFKIDRTVWPTRWEEYSFVCKTLAKVQAGVALDAGSGFDPKIHVLPYALESLGWTVMAVDGNIKSLDMPGTMKVVRHMDDLRTLWRWQESELDAWVCVSTLEHLEPLQQSWMMAADAAFGCLKSGGIAVLTADMIAPSRLNAMLRWAGFETGPIEPSPSHMLTPPVSFAIGRKP